MVGESGMEDSARVLRDVLNVLELGVSLNGAYVAVRVIHKGFSRRLARSNAMAAVSGTLSASQRFSMSLATCT